MWSDQRSRRPSSFEVERLERRELFAAQTGFVQTNLTSDGSITANFTDSNLVDPRGLAQDPRTGQFWVADDRASVLTAYDAAGAPAATVTVPTPSGANGSFPAALAVNPARGAFTFSSGSASGPTTLLIATEAGQIDAYNPSVNASTAVVEVDNSSGGSGAVYKGIAVVGAGAHAEILAANFRTGQIDLFDSHFRPVSNLVKFQDLNVAVGYAPFNARTIDGKVYVSYAEQDPSKISNVSGAGAGYVDVFSASGKLLERLAVHGNLSSAANPTNSPFGVVKAPAGFGRFGGDILIGNFGDGTIDAFDHKGRFAGYLTDTSGNLLSIDGLWGLANGTGADRSSIYFTAGPNFESDGLFGTIKPRH